MNQPPPATAGKLPEITLLFWIIKIAATTVGETGGDTVTMSMHLGYLTGSIIFVIIFLAFVAVQLKVQRFHPFLYWAVIIATTTAGTTIADFADRSLGIGYAGGVSILAATLMISLAVWYWSTGSVSMESVATPTSEMFYWVTIMFSQTLGTALGDWLADTRGLGYAGGAAVFTGALGIVILLYFLTNLSHTLLFWAAVILTRPLGATLGDLFDKPVAAGGFAMSRADASIGLMIFIIICLLAFAQRPGTHPGQPQTMQ